jgi:Ala-tRNA(Pro) deacylase
MLMRRYWFKRSRIYRRGWLDFAKPGDIRFRRLIGSEFYRKTPPMASDSGNSVFDRVVAFLEATSVNFQVLLHEAAYTSAESAAVRGVSLHTGAKALVVKAEDEFLMVVLPADFSLDSKKLKQELKCRKLRFANQEEVEGATNLKPGAIPPFGSLFNLHTYCDSRLQENEIIYFNAGSHTQSIGMGCADYLAVEHPTLGLFGKLAEHDGGG